MEGTVKIPQRHHFQYILDRWMDDFLVVVVGEDTKHEIYEALTSFNK